MAVLILSTFSLGAIVGVFGLAIGSFLNVVIWRVPRGLSVVAPRSACPGCDTPIAGRDNIPVVSWLLLRGKCRSCGTGIAARYPIVETVTAVAFALIGLAALAGTLPALAAPVLLYLAAITVALALIDLETGTLPDRIVLPSYAVVAALLLLASLVGDDLAAFGRALLGAVALFAAYFVMLLAYPRGMGFGDVKLAGVLGLVLAWFGWGSLIVGGFAAFVLGGVWGIVLVLTRRAGRGSSMPFGPWMLAGAWLGVVAGEPLFTAYLTLIGLT